MISPTVLITRETFGSDGWRAMIALRTAILRTPLSLAYDDAQLAVECDQIHFALRVDGVLAGTVLLVPPDTASIARLRQMAITPALAGRGLGRILVHHAETVLRAMDTRSVHLSARETAIGFYETLGYRAEGETYLDVTLAHRLMRKSLSSAWRCHKNPIA
jgi:predicted GNAT family N-acyltransferase